ncbi:MAG: large conductance mechanosensitive channel protein MscL [Candidatus Magasanikbacteria bacterium CG10_big_fil_rev_8_21_14_0_10_43_6]|uniref:Large-conductance mechanosensitive channel n=1 Tax=Candidatus Magasanikbacteria bacterium CG10_big_fil_rev_8_21_14_0_10_43_6 TaxID=1974650 RepID=A0A2M6W214_9BACT|nr:MAG: large conductance mechanosensitive channel protein MscL [Candidatus Magasanikbacteria bacterium CG10_big_fil_rev_8_21_14_0_10_43_6]
MFKEFKAFAMKGNVIDMAVGVIIGAGFGKIVTSLVSDVIMPPIGFILGGVDFSSLNWVIKGGAESTEAITLNYGLFLNTVIDFLIIAFVIFIAIKQLEKFKKKEKQEKKSDTTPENILLLRDIRDALKK